VAAVVSAEAAVVAAASAVVAVAGPSGDINLPTRKISPRK
jgi:hypothetical protein